jgi:hypothetical protein
MFSMIQSRLSALLDDSLFTINTKIGSRGLPAAAGEDQEHFDESFEMVVVVRL